LRQAPKPYSKRGALLYCVGLSATGFFANPLTKLAVGSATGAKDEENTGPKLQLSLAAQFAGSVSGADEFCCDPIPILNPNDLKLQQTKSAGCAVGSDYAAGAVALAYPTEQFCATVCRKLSCAPCAFRLRLFHYRKTSLLCRHRI
jgi:hypothetical protein